MTTIDRLKELERDMRKESHNLIASNYLTLEDLCECIKALELCLYIDVFLEERSEKI